MKKSHSIASSDSRSSRDSRESYSRERRESRDRFHAGDGVCSGIFGERAHQPRRKVAILG